MRALSDFYWTQFKTYLTLQFQHRAGMLIWLLAEVVEPITYLIVWRTVSAELGGQVGIFRASDFAAYYITLLIVSHITFTWVMWDYEPFIRYGTLANRLLRPIHPIHVDIAQNLAYKVLNATVLFPMAGLLILIFKPSFNTDIGSFLIFLPVLVLAAVLRFLAGWTLTMAAFWFTRVDAINAIYLVMMFFFSGRIAPLELFPMNVQFIANLLPFRWMLWFPIEVLLGKFAFWEIIIGIVAQLFWIGVFLWLRHVLWQAGVRRFSSVGT